MAQVQYGLRAVQNALNRVAELALGGTAVGTGINTPDNFAKNVARKIAEITETAFCDAPNKFEALASMMHW